MSLSAFPRRELDLASNPGSLSWGLEAKPDHDSVGWYETLQSCAAACRLVLISIITKVFKTAALFMSDDYQ